ncbi:MAG: hypothetical protein WBZ29_15925 [Methanocella sp.]
MSKADEGKKIIKIDDVAEMFPGLLYRTNVPEVVALLFGSGKLAVTGGKKPKDAKEVVDRIVQELEGIALI